MPFPPATGNVAEAVVSDKTKFWGTTSSPCLPAGERRAIVPLHEPARRKGVALLPEFAWIR
jgi:hypothetical protein